jgi:UDP-glucose 4-epimerase
LRPARQAIRLTSSPTCDRIRSTLKWQPRYDDLQTIVTHALA